ncbi:MAG: hypothetical protein QXN55_01300 [Candidatus Nitrosotenuis sp.]
MSEEIKKRKNSKAKGNGFESRVAKTLAEHLVPLKFIRTQSSGARVGGKNFGTTGHLFNQQALSLFVGDVVATNDGEDGHWFRFVVECKFYKEPDTLDQLLTRKAKVFGWLDEVDADKVKVGKDGIVIMKFNGKDPLIAVRPEIELPFKNYLTIGDTKIAYLKDALAHPEFWLKNENTASI